MGKFNNLRSLVAIWFSLRLLTMLWVALVSPLQPETTIEKEVAFWPPSEPYSRWLERAFLAPWERWDVDGYTRIIVNGYEPNSDLLTFHPLFSWLATPVAWIVGNPLFALVLVSSAASLAYLIAFEKLARIDFEPSIARTSTLLMLFYPSAFSLFAPYTEALFLLLSVLCFLWARQRSWWLAGLAGGLAALTRQQGVLLFLPVAWELWTASEQNVRQTLRAWRDWIAVGLIPAGLLVWIVYRALVLNDNVQPDFSSLHSLIYSIIISPNAQKIVPEQSFLWPWQALWLAVQKLFFDFEPTLAIDLFLGFSFLGLTVLAWPRIRTSYRIYMIAIIVISFAYHTGPYFPYMGLPRHLFIAFPVFIGLGAVPKQPWQRLLLMSVGLFSFLFLLLLYVIRGWIP
jgi:Gpi18-like mannosyltransferase